MARGSLFENVYNRHVPRRSKASGGPTSRYPLDSLLLGFECRAPDEHKVLGTAGDPVPPFACPFSREAGSNHLLAVPSEDGVVQIYDTEKPHKGSKVLKAWLAHSNAVFDCAWMPGESKLVTASGDQMAKLWDVCSGEALGSFKGHQCSLKSVAFGQSEKAVFCTGGRDGNIMIWDVRCSKRDGFYSAVKRIGSAHNAPTKISVTPKRRNTPRGMAPSVDSQQSVTAVIFQDEKTLVSSGAVDGVIKVWDLRKNYTSYRMGPVPMQSYPYPGSSSRKRGFSSLVLDRSSSLLFANCTDDSVYMFNITGTSTAPVATFRGHLNSSFYVKSSLSPDGEFLLSGSSDDAAYIWKVADPLAEPVLLRWHSLEVTSVAWCPTDFTKIVTCSDDNKLLVWRLNRGTDQADCSTWDSDLLARASRANKPGKATGTPAKRPLGGRAPSHASPRAAACVLGSSASLPSPSFSESSLRSAAAPQAASRNSTAVAAGAPSRLGVAAHPLGASPPSSHPSVAPSGPSGSCARATRTTSRTPLSHVQSSATPGGSASVSPGSRNLSITRWLRLAGSASSSSEKKVGTRRDAAATATGPTSGRAKRHLETGGGGAECDSGCLSGARCSEACSRVCKRLRLEDGEGPADGDVEFMPPEVESPQSLGATVAAAAAAAAAASPLTPDPVSDETGSVRPSPCADSSRRDPESVNKENVGEEWTPGRHAATGGRHSMKHGGGGVGGGGSRGRTAPSPGSARGRTKDSAEMAPLPDKPSSPTIMMKKISSYFQKSPQVKS